MIDLIRRVLGINQALSLKLKGLELFNEAIVICTEKDYARAFPMMTAAAELGAEIAMSHLGVMYLQGNGVAVNGKEAERWLKAAVEAGYEPAVSILGMAYVTGHSQFPRDLVKGRELLIRAAGKGDVHAREMLEMLSKKSGHSSRKRRK